MFICLFSDKMFTGVNAAYIQLFIKLLVINHAIQVCTWAVFLLAAKAALSYFCMYMYDDQKGKQFTGYL